MKRRYRSPRLQGARHTTSNVFESSAVAHAIEDISALRGLLWEWKSRGVEDVRSYLDTHPLQLVEAIHSITVVDVNAAMVELLEARSREEALGSLGTSHEPEEVSRFKELIVAIAQDRGTVEYETSTRTLRGKRLDAIVRAHIPAEGIEDPFLLVSVIDNTERKGVERMAEEERNLLLTLINNIPDIFFLKDRAGRFRLVNSAFVELIGAAGPDELVGKSDLDVFPRAIAEAYRADDRLLMESSQRGIEREEKTQSARGEPRWLLTTKVPLVENDGSVTGILGIGRDITAKKRAEEALVRERALLSVLMENIPDRIYFKDGQSRFILMNRSHAKVFGLKDPGEAIGKTDLDYFTRESARVKYDDEQRIMLTGHPIVDLEERETWADRPDTWVSTTKMPLRDEAGNIIGTFGISRDITERRHVEERNIRLAALVESSTDAIVGLDLQRIVTSWNKGAETVYGYSAEEALGQPSTLFVPQELEGEASALRDKVLRGERVESFETERTRKDGTRMRVSLSLSPIRDAGGAIVGTASIARDITREKELQGQIARAQRLESLGILAGGIAHQFNNINMVVKGYLDALLNTDNLTDAARTYAEEALLGLQRSVDITERLQGLTSPHAGADRVRLNELVRSLLPRFTKRLTAQGASLNLDLHETPAVKINQAQLAYVITSLITNALDALLNCRQRIINISSGISQGCPFLDVSDTGCGVPAENLSRLFTPFFSTKGEWAPFGSPQSYVKGVGLSLAVCQSTVAEHGGRIEVENREGGGCTFRVLLPAEPPGKE
jgi:two-component system sensor histidine kinase/response regulator